ncbi:MULTISPECIES: NHLP-related RiPP peptide [Xanthomonas]|uniref:NHLP-related RiPP peptide n=1 Tax=Xanthomonas indica TaxID=2912242 RepID=A0AAU8I6A4_9XANT|nr:MULTISPECIES: NHLP-related RiPP peptide [Xanthomonas]MBB6368754.1 putative modified peptide [Xanthomonas sp. F10]MCI2261052.1 NHLP-related RiPP peptide [Xanthomonas indica]MXV33060.1 putative modified peptide [Xanthomonas sp. LMG 8989]UYC12457.1 NHLP-related RiPP peptide [Xanthomonas sp. CFBP 8445]
MANNQPPHPSPLDPVSAAALLDALINDDAFRAAFQSDPVAALASIGIILDADADTSCLEVGIMASKEELIAAREQLLSYLVSDTAFHNPHCFEANKVENYLKTSS